MSRSPVSVSALAMLRHVLGWMSAYTANHPSRDDDIRAPNNILKS